MQIKDLWLSFSPNHDIFLVKGKQSSEHFDVISENSDFCLFDCSLLYTLKLICGCRLKLQA